MKFHFSIVVALIAILGLCSLSATSPIDEDFDSAASQMPEEEKDASTVPSVMESDMAIAVAGAPAENGNYSVWNGHNITRGAPMQWCYVSYRGIYSHIEIWGRNWPMDNLGHNGFFLKTALRHRLISFHHWRFETCYKENGDNCPAKKWRGFTWRARCNSAIGATSRVENAIIDVSPHVNQAFQAGKGHRNDLCSHFQPDEDGKRSGRWEGELPP